MPSRENSPWPFKARPATASQGKAALSRIRVVTGRGLVKKVTASAGCVSNSRATAIPGKRWPPVPPAAMTTLRSIDLSYPFPDCQGCGRLRLNRQRQGGIETPPRPEDGPVQPFLDYRALAAAEILGEQPVRYRACPLKLVLFRSGSAPQPLRATARRDP